MNNSELMQEVENLKSRIEELEKELENVGSEDEKKYPVDGTMIYFLNTFGLVHWDSWGDWMAKRIKLLFDSGEVFLTKEGAEEYAEVKQIERELYALADDEEWNKTNEHWSLCYDFVNDDIDYFLNTSVQRPVPYFASRESLTAAIEKVGKERVVKWLTYKRVRGNYK